MICNGVAKTALLGIAEQLFAQVKAVGQFGLGMSTTASVLDAAMKQRIGFTRSLLQALEQVAGLRFGDNEVPLCYNTADWPPTGALLPR